VLLAGVGGEVVVFAPSPGFLVKQDKFIRPNDYGVPAFGSFRVELEKRAPDE
jgi:hypothetical protein